MPHPILTKIHGVPTGKSIKTCNNELTGNAVLIATNLGCGTVGYAQLTLSPAAYANLTPTRWASPTNPGSQPLIPTTANSCTCNALNRTYNTEASNFANYVAVSGALQKQLITAVKELYIITLKQQYI